MINVGDKAPEVLGINEKGEEIRLSAYKGKRLCCISIRKTAHRVAPHKRAICATTTPNCARPAMK